MMPTMNVLIASSYPILNHQWVETFMDFDGYQNFNIINVSNGDPIEIKKNNVNIVLVSLQDSKSTGDGWDKKKFDAIRNVKFDLVGIDEIHMGVETEMTNELLERIEYKHLIGMSATPGRNLSYGRFDLDNCHFYDLVDEMNLKKSGHKDYQAYEDIHFVCPQIDVENRNIAEMKEVYSKDEGFTFRKFLEVNDGSFVYEQAVEQSIRMMFGIGKFQKNKNSILKKNCKGVLITVEDSKSVVPLQEKLSEMVGEHFNIYWTTSKENDVKALYQKVHNEWYPDNEKGSIVIVVDQLKTGVTLPWCDSVIFMNDCKSASEWIQTAFRCQSPRRSDDPRFGKGVYVYDMNVNRALHCIHQMTELRQATKGEGKEYIEILREVLDCLPIYTSSDGINFETIGVERFIEMKRKMTFVGYYENCFGNTIIGSKIGAKEAEFLSKINVTGKLGGKVVADMHKNDLENGKNENNKKNKGGTGKMEKKELSPEEKAKILANTMIKEMLMVCPETVMNIEDLISLVNNTL